MCRARLISASTRAHTFCSALFKQYDPLRNCAASSKHGLLLSLLLPRLLARLIPWPCLAFCLKLRLRPKLAPALVYRQQNVKRVLAVHKTVQHVVDALVQIHTRHVGLGLGRTCSQHAKRCSRGRSKSCLACSCIAADGAAHTKRSAAQLAMCTDLPQRLARVRDRDRQAGAPEGSEATAPRG